jgi:uncharacterized membrane protein
MANGFSGPVAQIVDNYLVRLRKSLRGFPARDQEELIKEIHSHIYESFRNDPTDNEVERILKVLDKLGEPAAVASARLPEAMVTMGRKKKLPFYILAGTLIALFGVPLGLGGLSLAFGLVLTVLSIVLAFYVTAFGMILAGWLSALIMAIRIFSPQFLDPYINTYPILSDPTLNTLLYLLGCLVIAAVGLGMLWLGTRMLRGVKFVLRFLFEKIRNWRKRAPLPAQQQEESVPRP